jgi:hypothetical protein
MGAAAHLINRFANSLDFYWNTRMAVLEQWMLESYPEVVEQLQVHGVYADFAARLNAYREELVQAAATVSTILAYRFDDLLEHDIDGHLVLSGLSSRNWSGDVQHLDRETLLVSVLLDKHAAFSLPALSLRLAAGARKAHKYPVAKRVLGMVRHING